MRARTSIPLLLFASLGLTAQTPPTAPAQTPSLRDARLPPKVRSDIVAEIVEEEGEADGREIALNSSVSFLKLSRHGSPAIAVENDTSPQCGAHGNCPFYLFLNVNGQAVLIFQAVGYGPGVEPAIHHGMHDISSTDVFSTAIPDEFVEVDRFDGKAYTPAYCYHQTIDENGKDKESPHRPCR